MDLKELRERQSWTLSQKIDHSLGVIDQFYNRLDGKVYVSFSGGKDSTIVLWLARKLFPNIKAAFCNTGNEFPDIVKFVRQFDNVDWVKPKMKPQDVMLSYGFPLVSKKVSMLVDVAKRNPNGLVAQKDFSGGKTSYSVPVKWHFLLDVHYRVSSYCCNRLKKDPMKTYAKIHKCAPIMGIMASESNLREKTYVTQGSCNVLTGKHVKSLPLPIWTEQDVWDFINKYNIPIAEIYQKGAKRTGCMFCGYGCQFKDHNSLQMVYELYPKWYDKFMDYTNNGVTYREALRDVLSVNGLYLPDERPKTLFDFCYE